MVKGIHDISTIREELKDYEEVEMPYNFINDSKIKYITLEEGTNSEAFYTGGNYLRKGNEKIFLQNGPVTWLVPVKIRDDENNIIYESKFFVEKDDDEYIDKTKEMKEYIDIIKAQQMVIEKMTKTIKEDKLKLQKYEMIIQKLKNYTQYL